MPDHSRAGEGFRQPKDIGVNTDHNSTRVSLHSHCRMHQLSDGVAQFAGGLNTALTPGFKKMFLEKVSIAINKHQNEWVALLTPGLSFVLLSTFLDFLIITFQGAVVIEEIFKLVQQTLQIFMVALIFLRQGC